MLTDMINIQYNFFLFVTIKETYYFSSIKQHYKKYIVLNVLNEKDNTVIQWQRDRDSSDRDAGRCFHPCRTL